MQDGGASIVALSALLTVTMPSMRATMQAPGEAGVRVRVKVMLGGTPVTEDHAQEIGADGHGDHAVSAVALARSLAGA